MPVQHVGRPLKRLEDPKLITGRDPYVNDVRLEGALTLAFVRSPHAHALIKSIDTRAARALPGVVAVLTGADVNPEIGVIHTPIPLEMFDFMSLQGHTVLAEGRLRYVGEPVAVVAAERAEAAADAAEAVEVDYEPLPAVWDSERALEPGAPLLYPETGTNVAMRFKREQGDVDGAFTRAAVVVEARMISQRVIPFAMEPRACSAVWNDQTQKLTIWGDTQTPHRMRDQIAERLHLEPRQVHLMTGRVGGGFGAKVPVYQEDTLVPLLARRLKRPVRWSATRREDVQATGHGPRHAHPPPPGRRRQRPHPGAGREDHRQRGLLPLPRGRVAPAPLRADDHRLLRHPDGAYRGRLPLHHHHGHGAVPRRGTP